MLHYINTFRESLFTLRLAWLMRKNLPEAEIINRELMWQAMRKRDVLSKIPWQQNYAVGQLRHNAALVEEGPRHSVD